MSKKRTIIPIMMLLVLLVQGCDKRCQCIGYNGGIVEYTTDELAALGKSCSDMVYYDGLATQRYSVCKWKYWEIENWKFFDRASQLLLLRKLLLITPSGWDMNNTVRSAVIIWGKQMRPDRDATRKQINRTHLNHCRCICLIWECTKCISPPTAEIQKSWRK